MGGAANPAGIRTALASFASRVAPWAAIAGGVLGAWGTASVFLIGIGPLGEWAVPSYALTTLSLWGAYAPMRGTRSKPVAAAAFLALVSFFAVVCFAAYFRVWSLHPPWLRVSVFWAAYAARPLAVLSFGLLRFTRGGVEAKREGVLLLALGLLGAASPVLYAILEPSFTLAMGPALLFGLPWFGTGLIEGAGWILFGLVILRSGRELRTRGVEEENRRKALRLYEEAFGAGDLSVVDELVARDFFDHLHHRRGPEEFKRTISDLRHTFPDLRLTVEEQTAEDDTVTTRCIFSGTDRGGVLWYPPTGKAATFTGTYLDRFSNGRLAEHRGETDTPKLLDQLGLSPSGDR